jgi:hypothetical protein
MKAARNGNISSMAKIINNGVIIINGNVNNVSINGENQ